MEEKDSTQEITNEPSVEEPQTEEQSINPTPWADIPKYNKQLVSPAKQKEGNKGWWKCKRFIVPTCIAILSIFAYSGSAGTVNDLEDKVKDLTEKNKDLIFESKTANNKLRDLTKNYDDYKAEMKPYEELSRSEAEAKKIAADKVAADKKAADAKIAADKKAADEKAAADAAAAKAAAEAQGYETGISYDQLARTPNDFIGQKVKFYGKVVQVMEGSGTIQIRLAADDNYDTMLYCEYPSSLVSSRVLEDDEVTIYGTSTGTISYKSTMGGTITIPGVSVEKIDQ